MQMLLPRDQIEAMRVALNRAGTAEIGGQIFGEQLAPSRFRVIELTFQKRRGTFARFFVDLVQAGRDALRFFERTSHRYDRFNYLGEWHSHPSFAVQPSGVDVDSMKKLVRDREFRGNFAVLVITKLDVDKVVWGAWVFDTQGREQIAQLEAEQ